MKTFPGPSKRGSTESRRRYLITQIGRESGFECTYCHAALVQPGREAVLCEITPEGWEPKPGWSLPTIDHVIPISKGGLDNPENVVLACWPCNYEKRQQDHRKWLAAPSEAFKARFHRSLVPRSVHRLPDRERAGQDA